MKLPSCPRTLIINILRKHPDGLTITSIAELAGMHRHTATKYVYELKGAGVINERDVGSAKLCYLREGLSRSEERKVVDRLNGNGNGSSNWRKSSTGQVQILTVFLFLFLVPAGIIIAQNATESINSTGELILEQMNITPENFTGINQSEIANETPLIEANATLIENISDETSGLQNQTFEPENITIQENSTAGAVLNETVSNETIQNETNATISLPDSQATTPPEAGETNGTLPEILQPILSVRISSQDKTLRGEQFDISAVATNSGNSDAKNVRLEWILPEGIEIVSGDGSAECGTISPDSECASSLTVSAPISAGIGKNEIRVIVRYEE